MASRNPQVAEVGTVQLSRDLLNQVRKVAALEDTTMTAIVVGILQPAVERRLAKAFRAAAAAELAAAQSHDLGDPGA